MQNQDEPSRDPDLNELSDFDSTVIEPRSQRSRARMEQTYRVFLKDIAARAHCTIDQAERAAVAVLSTLELRLSSEEARDMESQLPVLLTDLLRAYARPPGEPPGKFDLKEFYRLVADELHEGPGEVPGVVRAVFQAVKNQISAGEVEDVASQLPRDIGAVWNESATP